MKYKLGQKVFYFDGEEVGSFVIDMVGLSDDKKGIVYTSGERHSSWYNEKDIIASEDEAKKIVLEKIKKRHKKELARVK